MNLISRTKRIVGALLATAVVLSAQVMPTLAVDIPDYRLQVSPPTLDLDLAPGKTSTGSFKVQNTGLKAYDFVVGVAPYNVTNEDYTPDYDNETSYNSIINWVSFSQDSGSIEPNEEVEITVTVRVPSDVPAGGQYAMVYVQMVDDQDNADGMSITTTKRIGIIIYSEISGTTRQSASIIENKIPTILFNPPIIATSTVRNDGNVHGKATYKLEVYPLFSNEAAYTNESDPATLYVLPESSRFNTVSWNGAPRIGIFRVRQTISIYNETSVQEKIVFIIPIWFLVIILLLIATIIYWIVKNAKERGVKDSEA